MARGVRGRLLGFSLDDAIAKAGIAQKDILQFVYPGDEAIGRVGVTGIFLGYYKPWDGYAHALLAQGHGLEMWPVSNEGALNNYEHMDNLHAGIHDYFKYLKFGFSRTTDHCSLHIRRGRLTRDQALAIVRGRDGRFPSTYLETTLEETLDDLHMTMEEFHAACDRHTNTALFKKDTKGELIRRKDGSPEKINDDNVEGASVRKRKGPLSVNKRTQVVTAAASCGTAPCIGTERRAACVFFCAENAGLKVYFIPLSPAQKKTHAAQAMQGAINYARTCTPRSTRYLRVLIGL